MHAGVGTHVWFPAIKYVFVCLKKKWLAHNPPGLHVCLSVMSCAKVTNQ